MTSPAWDRAVGAMAAAHFMSARDRRAGGWSRLDNRDYLAIGRAALPALFAAVVENMAVDGGAVYLADMAGDPAPINPAALLAALTDAAGRVGG